MPIENLGTLLENIVLVETARFVMNRTATRGPIEFVNSFAMPPISEWRTPVSSGCFNPARRQTLHGLPPLPPQGYAGLFRTLTAPPPSPGEGPSGALLVGLLARRMGVPVRFWLNDLANGAHYPGTIAGLQEFAHILQTFEPVGPDPEEVVVCAQPYDVSLGHLTQTLANWHERAPAAGRIAFLDPNRYRTQNRVPGQPETSSRDHRSWLRLVAQYAPVLTAAVHFTGHRFWADLEGEIAALREDATLSDYHSSITFSHNYYTTTVSLRYRDGPEEALSGRAALIDAVRRSWREWGQVTGGPCILRVDELRDGGHLV